MMPFVWFFFGGGGTPLSNLLDCVMGCRGAVPHKTSWFLILSVDNRIDHCLPRTCCPLPLPFTAEGKGPRCPARSPITLYGNRLFQGVKNRVVKHSADSPRDWFKKNKNKKDIEISRNPDTYNWDFMPCFLTDPKPHSVLLQSKYFPEEWDERKCFSGFIWFLFL